MYEYTLWDSETIGENLYVGFANSSVYNNMFKNGCCWMLKIVSFHNPTPSKHISLKPMMK